MLAPLYVDYRLSMTNQEFANRIRSALDSSLLVVTTGVEPSPQQKNFWDDVSERIGTKCFSCAEDYRTGRSTGEKWNEIRYDPAIQNAYRYSSNAQPLHTDCSYTPFANDGIMFFFCISQARTGGETVF